jgi:hypothetical protein
MIKDALCFKKASSYLTENGCMHSRKQASIMFSGFVFVNSTKYFWLSHAIYFVSFFLLCISLYWYYSNLSLALNTL